MLYHIISGSNDKKTNVHLLCTHKTHTKKKKKKLRDKFIISPLLIGLNRLKKSYVTIQVFKDWLWTLRKNVTC